MAYSTVYSSGHVANMVRKYVVDTVDELSTINVSQLQQGSTAFVIETSTTYMLNSKLKWIKIANSSSGSTGGNGDTDIIYDGGDMDDSNINYDGGDLDG